MIDLVLAASAGYLLGSIAPGVIAGRWRGIDLRQLGSGGTGFTNAVRHLGWRLGWIVLLFDVGKGALAAILGLTVGGARGGAAAAVAAVCGHVWPVFAGLRGGKGVAVTLGALAVLRPTVALAFAAIQGGLALASGFVSLGSIVAAAALPVLLFVIGGPAPGWAPGVVIAGLVLWAHRANLARLRQGCEPRWTSTSG